MTKSPPRRRSRPARRRTRRVPRVARKAPRAVRAALAAKYLVYVHGICKHDAGYSDSWWAALKPYVPGIPDGNRLEVLWSQVVTGLMVRAALPPKAAQLKQNILDVLHDRAQRETL